LYWYQVIDSRTLTNFWGILERESKKGPFWIQCSKPNCLKWRKLESIENLPEDWTCSMNIEDPERSSCDAKEEELCFTKTKKKNNLISPKEKKSKKNIIFYSSDEDNQDFENIDTEEDNYESNS